MAHDMSGWDRTMKEAASKSGKFIKLKEKGEMMTAALIGDPAAQDVYWEGNQKHAYDAAAEKAGKKRQTNYEINVYVFDHKGQPVPAEQAHKIYGFNVTTLKMMYAVVKNPTFPPTDHVYSFTRMGDKGDTKTFDHVMPVRPLTAEEKARIAAVKPHALLTGEDDDDAPDMNSLDRKPANGATNGTAHAPVAAAPSAAQAPAAPAPAPAVAKLSESDLASMRDRLRGIPPTEVVFKNEKVTDPRTKLTLFLAHFGVTKISDVHPGRVGEALATIDALVGPGYAWIDGKWVAAPVAPPPAPPAAEEIDPFA